MFVQVLTWLTLILIIFFFQKEDSEKEWAFKHAIRINTYSEHHPVPVPLNLVSNLVQVVFLLKKEEDKNRTEDDVNPTEEDEKRAEDDENVTEDDDENVSKMEVTPPRYYSRKHLLQSLDSLFLVL